MFHLLLVVRKSTKSWCCACRELLSTSIPGQQPPPFCARNPSPCPWFLLSLGTRRMRLFWTPVQLLRPETHLGSTQLAKVSAFAFAVQTWWVTAAEVRGGIISYTRGEIWDPKYLYKSTIRFVRHDTDPMETCILWSNSWEPGRTFTVEQRISIRLWGRMAAPFSNERLCFMSNIRTSPKGHNLYHWC